jgi:hypothetical protein
MKVIINYYVGTVDFVYKRMRSAIKGLGFCWHLLSHMRSVRDKTLSS